MPAELFDIYFSKSSSDSASLQGRLLGVHSDATWALPQPCGPPLLLLPWLWGSLSPRKCSYPCSFSDFPFSTCPYLLMFPWILSAVLFSFHILKCCLSFKSTVLTTCISWWESAFSLSARPRCVFVYWTSPGWKGPRQSPQFVPAPQFPASMPGSLSSQCSKPETGKAWPFPSLQAPYLYPILSPPILTLNLS